jgi:hypothetical protein
MSVRVVNIQIQQGANFNANYILEDPISNSLTNLTGYTVAAKLAKHPGSSTKTNFTTTITTSVGTVGISLTSGQTSALKPGRHVYDVLLTDSFGVKTRVIEGSAIVSAGVCT